MKRYVTYDIKEGNSYDELYDYFEQINAKMITKSTYETNSSKNLDDFCGKLQSVTSKGDSIFIISVNTDGQVFHRKAR